MRFKWTLLCLGALAVASAQDAQTNNIVSTVPRLIRISSTFAPADGGKPASVESVTLSIYRDEQGGSPLWQETQNVSADSAGRYSLLLGASASDGLPQDLFNSGEQRWLGVRFNRPGETEQPRSLLASVPYALKASDADTLGGLPASAYLHASSVGTPTTASTTNVMTVAGTTAVEANLRPRYSTGTANFIPLLLDTAGDTTNSVFYQNGSRIGLQTSSPLDYLHVVFNDGTGSVTGYAVQNLNSVGFSGMLFYEQNGTLGEFQGFNNSTHEYRINNIASGGSINFLFGSTSAFRVLSNSTNTLVGYGALAANTSGTYDTAVGYGALAANTTGLYNTAVGYNAINAGTGTGLYYNTAVGYFAGNVSNGASNVAVGYNALLDTTTGAYNTAIGTDALQANVTGAQNVALGVAALESNTGSSNIGIGFHGGQSLTSGSNNIDIGNVGTAGESGVIRIGTPGTQTAFYAGGIAGLGSGTEMVINTSTGQIGYYSSSRRYKEDIHDMGDASRGLMRLRPVTFRYKKPLDDGSKPIQYGLIAEEVAEVYPDLVVRNADGRIETVKYQVLAPMLLNEVQRQQSEIDSQTARLRDLEEEVRRQTEQNRALLERLGKVEAALSATTADSRSH